MPEGWFDASTGSDSTRNLVWLVQGDYAATIAVREIVLDEEAGRQVQAAGGRVVAELSLGLAAGSASTLILAPLDRTPAPGGEGYAFEQIDTATKDTSRTVVLKVGDRVFEVHALVVGGGNGPGRQDVFSAQQRFVEALRW